MFTDWQSAVTMLLISWALGYVAWRGWRIFVRKQAGGCGSCAKCPSEEKAPANLIQVESLLAPLSKSRQQTN
jgi:hypothetical protein